MKTNTKSSNIHFLLGDNFFDKATPAIFPNHVLRFRNNRAASRLNLDKLNDEDWISYLANLFDTQELNMVH